ncbi:MAG: AMP-binding protein [bacterium]|nr:AMP-binding protein [bacterium]
MPLNLASSWEIVADRKGDRLAVHCGGISRTWSELEDRAARLARALADVGVGAGDNVAIALYNGNEYIEAEFAAMKCRAAHCNVNYRYVEDELAYLVDNSDAKAVFFDDSLAERFDKVRGRLDKVKLWVHVGDGSCPDWAVAHEATIAANDPAPRIERSPDDLWLLYTGGTTGNPKGVMWPHGNLATLARRTLAPAGIELPDSLDGVPGMLDQIEAVGGVPRQLAASPLMHGTAGLTALMTLLQGGAVVSLVGRKFDADELWRVAVEQKCTTISIVGDVFCRPMVEALEDAEKRGEPYDLSALRAVGSSGVMWTQPVKDRLLVFAKASGANLVLNDSLGASEGVGFAAKQSSGGGDTETATFTLGPNAAVFTEDGRRVVPGSDETGLLAVTGPIPLGYYGDPVKTAETFREFEGKRWSVPGDWARIAADGTVTLLGRGSVSINTGGEKVYPEEVEEALKLLPEVVDVNVVGVPDPKWGAAVTAVLEVAAGFEVEDKELVDKLRGKLSPYKLPKNIVRVEKFFRSPNGKSDFKWATRTAREALGLPDDA